MICKNDINHQKQKLPSVKKLLFNSILKMLKIPFFRKTRINVCFLVFISLGAASLDLRAEYLSRSRLDTEIQAKAHNVLRKTLGDEYINVSVVQHTFLDDKPVKQESEILPGVKISSNKTEIKTIFRYRTIVLTVNQNVTLD